ncbi:hypothetical protein FA09DRAFT_323368 [Tilletiopsis washingtonensis]|uniref:HTH APSES-type domain-containing protein n=1 Tax=Tilletiopsis washingtonensis TaxID=58919 RepID=A0A316Z091_9BASI|nr:hypothetical protein FA09DRAFT_323368 [Tilletiopsis washingtonensis]PWN94929.1 hypothetical protein FA09DRAFT_323368 [Tilletiopsis washingtonensis]
MQGYPGASYASSSSAAQHRGPPHPSAPLAAPPGHPHAAPPSHPHAAPPPSADVASPPARPAATVYLATYSNVPVYELTVRGIACMRRRADGFLNATQILKIAGVEKARRTKILEREILTGEHEKVQGGYGKYQGTWIPLARAQALSAQFNVTHFLLPLLELDPTAQVPLAGPRRRPNPNAPAASMYYRTGPGAAQLAAKASTPGPVPAGSPPAPLGPGTGGAPSQGPRFLSLRPPAPGAPPMSDMSPSRSDVVPAGVPAGTDARSRAALEAFASHGYTPAGVQLPDLTGYTSHMPPTQPSNGSSNKRRAPSVSRDDSPSRAGPDAKRAKQLVDDGSAAEAPLSTQGPSPVKDLNQLGRFSPSASLRGARPVSRVRPGPPDSSGLGNGSRFASRPHVVSDSEPERRARELMTELFVDGQTVPAGSQALEMLLGELPEASADVVIDDHGHTALHWAAALARLPLVELLLSQAPPRGADVHAGNHAGETALQRAVLVTNAYEASVFPALLHLLGATLHTRDFRRRTILHHIALICALPKRAASARYYLACVLDHLTRVEGGRYASLVDAQDEDGETALGIVARGGNGSMVRMLLEVGARKDIANQLGIRPRDWGIEGEAGEETSELAKERPADAVAALKSVPPAPVQKSADVQQQMSTVLADLAELSAHELQEKTAALEVVRAHLQAATRELGARRRRAAEAQRDAAVREETGMRTNNLWRMLYAEMGWGTPAPSGAIDAHAQERDALARTSLDEEMQLDQADASGWPFDGEPKDEQEQLVRLRWLKSYYEKSTASLEERIGSLDGESVVKQRQCRKVVAMCCNVPEDHVEDVVLRSSTTSSRPSSLTAWASISLAWPAFCSR